jgi:hypothetical protein
MCGLYSGNQTAVALDDKACHEKLFQIKLKFWRQFILGRCE